MWLARLRAGDNSSARSRLPRRVDEVYTTDRLTWRDGMLRVLGGKINSTPNVVEELMVRQIS